MTERPTVVISRHWRESRCELAFVTRSIAGAASRAGPVTVFAPGPAGVREADGAFDVQGLGDDGAFGWPPGVPADSVVIVDELTPDIAEIGAAGLFLTASSGVDSNEPWRRFRLVAENGGNGGPPIGLFVPVNPMAARHRHHGFGFTGYVLVLSGRASPGQDPPASASWLTSSFHDLFVVVVEDAVASAWKGRALRGSTSVDTRIDLWRLMAHAAACVDLAPGSLVARECIESLRLGTPIIVPDDASPAALHARSSGGSTFKDAWDLLEATEKFCDGDNRASAATQGREYADAWFGEPAAFVDRLDRWLRPPGSPESGLAVSIH